MDTSAKPLDPTGKISPRRTGWGRLRSHLRVLYHGQSRGAQRFQAAVLIVDLAIIAFFVACYVVAYAGMAVAPVGGAWVWMVLAGIGNGMKVVVIGPLATPPESNAIPV